MNSLRRKISPDEEIDFREITEAFLKSVDLLQFLRDHRFIPDKDNGFSYRGTCPFHGGSGDNFVVYYKDPTHRYRDFHWKCESQCNAGGGLIGFVAKANGLDVRKDARDIAKYILGYMGLGDEEGIEIFKLTKERGMMYHEMDILKAHAKVVNKEERSIDPKWINETFVRSSIEKRTDYFAQRGFKEHVLNTFEVGFCHRFQSPWHWSPNPERMVIPIRDENFSLVGLSGRVVHDDPVNDKYNVCPGSHKGSILYGQYFSEPEIRETGKIIVFEGFCDHWRVFQAGVKNIVAIMGKEITPPQMKKILGMADTVYLALDNDKSGNSGMVKAYYEMKDYVNLFKLIPPEGHKDLGDCSDEEIWGSVNNAKRFKLQA